MSEYYTVPRKSGLYDPHTEQSFRLSRSKIDLFIECPRCFYLDRRLGIGRPPGYPFTINSAIDKLLKKEFDIHRAAGSQHPLQASYGLDAIPFQHEKMDEWRDSLRHGITYAFPDTNLIITGGVDDVWVTPAKELIIVDYKATAKVGEVTIDADWQDGYKRQMEIYQWLFRMNDFKVSDTGYFVYCNGRTDSPAFDGKIEFDVKLIPYTGKTDWIEKKIKELHERLSQEEPPAANPSCDYCNYMDARIEHA